MKSSGKEKRKQNIKNEVQMKKERKILKIPACCDLVCFRADPSKR
jgi:hypothetical protein